MRRISAAFLQKITLINLITKTSWPSKSFLFFHNKRTSVTWAKASKAFWSSDLWTFPPTDTYITACRPGCCGHTRFCFHPVSRQNRCAPGSQSEEADGHTEREDLTCELHVEGERGEQGVIWVQPQFLEPLAAPPHSRRSLKLELCKILRSWGTSREELEEWKQGGISRLVWWSGVTRALYFRGCLWEERAGRQQSRILPFHPVSTLWENASDHFLALLMSRSLFACWQQQSGIIKNFLSCTKMCEKVDLNFRLQKAVLLICKINWA